MGTRRSGAAVVAAMIAVAAFAPDAARAAADVDAFLAASGDPQTTLALEKTAADALARSDRKWFARTARLETKPLNRALSAIESAKRAPEDALKIGPCNLAWLTLRSYIVRTARDSAGLPKSASLADAAPKDVANLFAEQMSRCELVKRLPRGKRLIGADAGGI